MSSDSVLVNRAPVLTLWAAIVAERLGYDRATSLTLGKAVAGLNAQSKGRRLGLYSGPEPSVPRTKKGGEPARAARSIPLLGREVPVVRTAEGVRAVVKDRTENPSSVERYLEQKFGDALPRVEAAMRAIAKAYPPAQLAEIGFSLYEEFRPKIPEGVKGWGVKGRLDLALLRTMGGST